MKASKVGALKKMSGIFGEIIMARGKKKMAPKSDESKEDPKEEATETTKEEADEDKMKKMKK